MNTSISGLGGLRSSVAGMPISQNRTPKASFGAQMEQVLAQASPAADTAGVSNTAAAGQVDGTTQIEGRKDIWEPYTTYTPGEGYTGYLPGSDKPALRGGAEFWAQVRETAKQNAANKVEEPFTRKELTRAELAEFAAGLSEKYDPRSMTQEDYDSFLEDLMVEGLLSKDEVVTLGYKGAVVIGTADSLMEDGAAYPSFGGSCSVDNKTLESNPYYNRYGLVSSLQDTNGDALAYAVLMSLWKNPSGSAGYLDLFEKQNTGYTIMADVLGAVDQCR